MKIFNKPDQISSNHTNASIIAEGAKVKGELQVESNLHVHGEFLGTINSKCTVSVEKTGYIEGEIVSKKLIVTGRFVGTAHCEEIKILASGKVIGRITYSTLVLERGGYFEGECRPKESAEASDIIPVNACTV